MMSSQWVYVRLTKVVVANDSPSCCVRSNADRPFSIVKVRSGRLRPGVDEFTSDMAGLAKAFDLLVIGCGSGGLGMARRAAEFGAKVSQWQYWHLRSDNPVSGHFHARNP